MNQYSFLMQTAPPEGGILPTVGMMAVIFAIWYFLLIRPQNQAAEKKKSLIDALKKGDEVVTEGGILGVVQSVEGGDIHVEIAPKVVIRVRKSSVAGLAAEPEKKE